ncbi:unnamed protein product [Paramecium octaurelia]|uniref:Uncharacterized protein n=1 Tax=Paramecium octaurelia TaxID=43137 RepID=A0A8S1WWG7_PAROT|nr:unnamed protein product [Paramecium octaurelia]
MNSRQEVGSRNQKIFVKIHCLDQIIYCSKNLFKISILISILNKQHFSCLILKTIPQNAIFKYCTIIIIIQLNNNELIIYILQNDTIKNYRKSRRFLFFYESLSSYITSSLPQEFREEQKLLCQKSVDNLDSRLYNAINFWKASWNNSRQSKEEGLICGKCHLINVQQIEKLKETIIQLKSKINMQLDEFIQKTTEWVQI